MHGVEKRIVDILRSDSAPSRHYVGITNDVHVSSGTTTGPVVTPPIMVLGSLVVSIEFRTEKEAVRFEKYLKSGSGRAFAKAALCWDELTIRGLNVRQAVLNRSSREGFPARPDLFPIAALYGQHS